MNALLVPPHPARPRDWVPEWRGFFGERMRNSVYGWPEDAFAMTHRSRRILGINLHIITDPEMVGRVLLDNKANYERPGFVRRLIAPLIGNGLLAAEGEDWRVQRRIVAPSFAPGAVASLSSAIAEVAAQQVAQWPQRAARLDLAEAATHATMEIIARALFGGDPRLTNPAASAHIAALIAAGGRARLSVLLGLPSPRLTPLQHRAARGQAFLKSTLSLMVRERGLDGGADDFFGGMIRALRAQFPPTQAEALAVDNAITFYVAGHETTANALAWTIYLLAAQPELQAQARAEAQAALAGDPINLPDATPLLRAILDESLRLYPPAPRFDRQALDADTLGPLSIGRGDVVTISPWLLHRNARLWENPDAFDHRRFIGEARATQQRYQYLPFGAGPRVCVGARFAIIEAQIILAHWLAARRFSITKGFVPAPVGSVTLRPANGMPLEVNP